jgi:acyl-CoA hydrolase
MEVGVKVFQENVITGKRRHSNSAYLTYVAVDPDGKPHAAPPVILKNAQEKRRYREAGLRRKWRVEQGARLGSFAGPKP